MTNAPPPPKPKDAPRTPPPGPFKPGKLVMREKRMLPPRLVIYAVEKWGKTTMAAHAPDPVVFMPRDDTGYDTLLGAGSVPQCPAVVVNTWKELLAWIDSLIEDQQGRKTIVLDTLGGFEQLCREHVCEEHFKGDWGERGFAGFQRGFEITGTEWLKLIHRLDKLHELGLIVIITAHAEVKKFDDPEGPAYDRYQVHSHHKVWAPTARWADAILFGKFFSIVDVKNKSDAVVKQEGKAIGGTTRVMYCDNRDSRSSGNRYRMKSEFSLPNEPDQMWAALWGEITKNGEQQ